MCGLKGTLFISRLFVERLLLLLPVKHLELSNLRCRRHFLRDGVQIHLGHLSWASMLAGLLLHIEWAFVVIHLWQLGWSSCVVDTNSRGSLRESCGTQITTLIAIADHAWIEITLLLREHKVLVVVLLVDFVYVVLLEQFRVSVLRWKFGKTHLRWQRVDLLMLHRRYLHIVALNGWWRHHLAEERAFLHTHVRLNIRRSLQRFLHLVHRRLSHCKLLDSHIWIHLIKHIWKRVFRVDLHSIVLHSLLLDVIVVFVLVKLEVLVQFVHVEVGVVYFNS